ncbi:hypothetical protein E2H86_21380 [Pseudomonas putida]|nr:hypothetical protein E2H86_21380 [Pseudomonas putida]
MLGLIGCWTFVRGSASGPAAGPGCSCEKDGLHRFCPGAHYIYTTWRVQYKRLFEIAAGQ